MITIPVSLNEKQFDGHVRPDTSTAKRGFESKISLIKIFNYILYPLHTGFIVASTGMLAGNHNAAYHLKPHLQKA